MAYLNAFTAELPFTVTDPTVWLAIGLGLLLGAGCLLFGVSVARAVGLLQADAPIGEKIGVGLASGLIVLAAWWATIRSGGRSSFTPIALGFLAALVLAAIHRAGPRQESGRIGAVEGASAAASATPHHPRWLFVVLAGSVLFVVVVALSYGATMAPSPRNGVQPVEFRDTPFYAVLGRDLATTGTESTLQPSGFADLANVPSQDWYHWGELWLASAVITFLDAPPIAARYFIVLPLVLLAACALSGTLVRRVAGTRSSRAFLFGFAAALFLTPLQLQDYFFSTVLFGLIFGITNYGLATVAVLLTLVGLINLEKGTPSLPLVIFAGTAAASVLPSHIAIAILAGVGAGAIILIEVVRSLVGSRRPTWPPGWMRVFVVTTAVLALCVAWGVITGHSVGNVVSARVTPFNATWQSAIVNTIAGTGVFLAIPVAWLLVRRTSPRIADIYLATMLLITAGAISWGARIGDFNSFYLFFGAIEVFAAPIAAAAIWQVVMHLQRTERRRWISIVAIACTVQLGFGLAQGLVRLEVHGGGYGPPIPETTLESIRALPSGARVAYACRVDEVTYGTANLLTIDAHADHRIIPMCFEADTFGHLSGAAMDFEAPNSDSWAPQRDLFPTASASPSTATVVSFLRSHGIDYIYADSAHPNTLVPDAVEVARSADSALLRLP